MGLVIGCWSQSAQQPQKQHLDLFMYEHHYISAEENLKMASSLKFEIINALTFEGQTVLDATESCKYIKCDPSVIKMMATCVLDYIIALDNNSIEYNIIMHQCTNLYTLMLSNTLYKFVHTYYSTKPKFLAVRHIVQICTTYF